MSGDARIDLVGLLQASVAAQSETATAVQANSALLERQATETREAHQRIEDVIRAEVQKLAGPLEKSADASARLAALEERAAKFRERLVSREFMLTMGVLIIIVIGSLGWLLLGRDPSELTTLTGG
jgi:hypothetical protein